MSNENERKKLGAEAPWGGEVKHGDKMKEEVVRGEEGERMAREWREGQTPLKEIFRIQMITIIF